MHSMDVLEDLPHWRDETAVAEGARRLAGLYLTQAVAGVHQPAAWVRPDPWVQAAAGLLGRIVPPGRVLSPATSAIDVWRQPWIPPVATFTVEACLPRVADLLTVACPVRHQAAAQEMVRRRMVAVRVSAHEPVTATADLYGVLHGMAALSAWMITALVDEPDAVLAELGGAHVADPAALSAALRAEWRRRADGLLWDYAGIEHGALMQVEPVVHAALKAAREDLELIAPAGPDTAPDAWPGGWIARRAGRNVLGPSSEIAWQHEDQALAAVTRMTGPVDVVWAPFSRARGTAVLDRYHWDNPDTDTERGV
jgi:hypothetical protein